MPRKTRKPAELEGEQPLQAEAITVSGHWEAFEQVPIVFANHIFVRLIDGQFLVTFGHTELPYELGPLSKETVQKLKTEGVPIRAVARLAIAPEKMAEMIRALSEIHDSWRKTQEEQ